MNDYDEHWKFVLEHEKQLRKLCRYMCRGRYDLEDELFSEVCSRIRGILNTYDSEKGACLKTHVFKSARWYLWKWMNRAGRPRAEREWVSLPTEDAHESRKIDHTASLEVNNILEKLPRYDQVLLRLYHQQGYTFQEIGQMLSISKGTARNHYLIALERAKELADES